MTPRDIIKLLSLCTIGAVLLLSGMTGLAGCAGDINDSTDPRAPRLLGTDENGVKIYAFYYGGYTRCYVVYPTGTDAMASNQPGGKSSKDLDAAPAATISVSPEDAELLKRVKAAGIK